MPSRELIHSTDDVRVSLRFALESGLQVMLDAPQTHAHPRMIESHELPSLESGVFQIFRPEWVFGPFEMSRIDGGHNEGKYFVHAHTNYSPITLYFQGERLEGNRQRLGAGEVSFKRDWLAQPNHEMRATPPDVAAFFEQLIEKIFSGIVVRAEVHKYEICREALAFARSRGALPPFDFIPWTSELFESRAERK